MTRKLSLIKKIYQGPLNADRAPLAAGIFRNQRSTVLSLFAATSLLFASGVGVAQAAETKAGPAAAANPDKPHVLMTTSEGEILLELDRRLAPKSVENFLGYVSDEFYNGTIFHRVIDGFMIQGGGFTADFKRKETRDPIRNEANNGLKNQRYTISMARTNAPHSATSQFFINTEDNLPLDHTGATQRGWGYAVFGRVVDGVDVVKTISQTITGPGGPFSRDAPQKTIVIEKVALMPAANDAVEAVTETATDQQVAQ